MSSKITALTSLSSPQSDDVIPVVDVHDTSMAPSGTTKQITIASLQAASPTLSYRGQVQYSTAYNPADVVLYNGERIYITGAVTTGSGTNGLGTPFISGSKYVALSSFGIYYAADYGVKADGTTDDWAALQSLLILLRSLTTNSFNGFRVILPTGTIALSKTLILPTQTMLQGQGLYSTAIKILAAANCDVMQPEQFNSSAQAALLTPLQSSLTAGNLRNAFRWGLRDLTLHGNSTQQTPGTYKMCLNVATNPLTSTGTGDPDFDPAGLVENVQFRAATGDGFFHNGRSALRMTGCIAWFCQGNGFSPSFDTQIDHCQAGFNGIAGFYLNHNAGQGAGNKSYNNGAAAQWVSGSNYTAGVRVMSGGLPYDAISTLTNDTTAPASDPSNWAPVTATSPAAWGAGVYCDSGAGEITFNCDCQENSGHNWQFHNCTGAGIYVSGVSSQPNFSQATSLLNTTNPNNYAHLSVDGSNGVQAALACGDTAGHTATQYRLRIVNGSTRDDITLTGDTNATFLSPDSLTLIGSGNSVSYNGASFTSTLTTLADVSMTTPGNGTVPTYNAATHTWQAVSPPSGNYDGAFGDGSDGLATLDGTATVSWASKAGSLYTMTRDALLTGLTVNSGVTLLPAGNRIFCQGTVTNNGTIRADGNNGSANGTAGAATTADTLSGGVAGGAGQTGNGTAGSNGTATTAGVGSSGAGGAGSSGTGGGAASAQSTGTWMLRVPQILATGCMAFGGVRQLGGGPGAGGGGGDGTNKGGGGGSGGGLIGIAAWAMTNGATGLLSAVAGSGGTPASGNCGGGGGGGGGLILVFTLAPWTNSGTTAVTGGAAGTASGTGANGTAGGAGNVLNVVVQAAGGSSPVTSVTAGDASISVTGTASSPVLETGTLDQIATLHPAAAAVGLNSQKITGLANGTVSTDAAAFGQIPAALPPNGTASGDLGGSYPSPTVTATHLASALPVNQGGTGSTTRNFAGLLTPTSVKTSGYTAAAGDFVPCDTTSGGLTVTLPNAPADLAVVGIKHVIQGGTNTVTVACAGSDVFNKAGGATSATLTLLAQGLLLQYKASGGTWYVLADDLPLTQLDSRYVAQSSLPLAIGSGGTGQATQQAALDALAGAATSNRVLAGDGTHVTLRALAAADLPAATTSLQGAVILDGTAGDIQPVGLQAAGVSTKAAAADHVHQANAWLSAFGAPAGATAETFPRVLGQSTSGVPTSGVLQVTLICLPKGLAVNNITFFTGSSVKTGGTHGWHVLLDSGLVVRAVSADQTDPATVWGVANTAYTLSVAGSAYTTTYTGLYYIGVMVAETAGTMPTFATSNALVAPLLSTAPVPGGTSSTGQTTPPATGTTMGALTGTSKPYYGYTS